MFIRYFFLSAIFSWLMLCGLNQLDFFRWRILEGEFGIWSAKIKLIEDARDKKAIIILGDSRASSAYHPSDNSKIINLSLGGTSPIQGYFVLNRLINNNTHIEKLIISYTPGVFGSSVGFLNNRALIFNFYHPEEFNELVNIASNQNSSGNDFISI